MEDGIGWTATRVLDLCRSHSGSNSGDRPTGDSEHAAWETVIRTDRIAARQPARLPAAGRRVKSFAGRDQFMSGEGESQERPQRRRIARRIQQPRLAVDKRCRPIITSIHAYSVTPLTLHSPFLRGAWMVFT